MSLLIFTLAIGQGSVVNARVRCELIFTTEPVSRSFLVESTIFSPIYKPKGSTTAPHIQDDQILKSKSTIGESQREAVESLYTVPRDPSRGSDPGFLFNTGEYELYLEQLKLWQAMQALHGAYGNRMSEAEKKLTTLADISSLYRTAELQRAGYVVIRDKSDPKKIAAVGRVYDGSLYNDANTIRGRSSPQLPAEAILAANHTHTEIFARLRSEGVQIFELGKYLIADELEAPEKQLVKKELFSWILENYLSPERMLGKKTMFVIDAISPVHERAYRQLYGAKSVASDAFVPPLKSPDFIMLVDADTLRAHLEAQLIGL